MSACGGVKEFKLRGGGEHVKRASKPPIKQDTYVASDKKLNSFKKEKKRRSWRRQHLLNIRKDKRARDNKSTDPGSQQDEGLSDFKNLNLPAPSRAHSGSRSKKTPQSSTLPPGPPPPPPPPTSTHGIAVTKEMGEKGLDELGENELAGKIPWGLKVARNFAIEKKGRTTKILERMKEKEKREQQNDPQHYMTLEMLGEGMQMSQKNTTVTKVDLSYDPRAGGISRPCGSFAVWGNPHWKQKIRSWAIKIRVLKGPLFVGLLLPPYSPILCDGSDLSSPAWMLSSQGLVYRIGFAGRELLNPRKSFNIPEQRKLQLQEGHVVVLSHAPHASKLTVTVHKHGGWRASFTLHDVPPLARPFVNLLNVGDSFKILKSARARKAIDSLAKKADTRPVAPKMGYKQRQQEREERHMEKLRAEELSSYEDSQHMVTFDKVLHQDSLFEEEDGRLDTALGIDDPEV